MLKLTVLIFHSNWAWKRLKKIIITKIKFKKNLYSSCLLWCGNKISSHMLLRPAMMSRKLKMSRQPTLWKQKYNDKRCTLHHNCGSVEYTNHKYPSTWSLFLSVKSIAWLHSTHLRGFARQSCPCSHWISSKTGPLERVVISARFIAQDCSSNCLIIISHHSWLFLLRSTVSCLRFAAFPDDFSVLPDNGCDPRQTFFEVSQILHTVAVASICSRCVNRSRQSFFSYHV